MKKRRVFLIVLLACVLSFVCAFVAACNKNGNTSKDVAVTSVTLNKDEVELQLGVTETVTLTAIVTPDNATNKTVTWSSDRTSVATVSNGVVTAVSEGTAIITATAGGKSDTCTVRVISASHTHTADSTWHTDETNHWHLCITGDGAQLDKAAHTYDNDQDTTCNVCGYVRTVTPPAEEHTHVADTSVWVSDETYHWHNCTANDGAQLDKAAHTYDNDQDATCNVCGYTRTITPSDYTANGDYVLDIAGAGATAGIYSWTKGTSDGGFGTNANDSVKYFKISAGSGAYDYLYINLKLQARKIITITGTARTSNLTDSTKSSTVGISLKSGSTGAVTGLTSFSVSQAEGNKNINLVGNVTTEGVIVLQLSRTSGNTGCELLSFTVTISDPAPIAVENVSLDKNNSSLKVGETETLVATVSPADADNTNIIWSSSDETIATVVNGVVTAKKAGQVTITATSAADSSKKASCSYTITNVAPTSIELNRTTATIALADTLNLTATVLPSNATVKTVTWTSSDDNIATVVNGVVTPKTTGTVTITATSTENASLKAECSVTIKSTIVYATGISLNYTNESLKVDDTLQLTATITPADTDDKSVTWETSNASVATVSASGLVTVVGEGSATITAISNSNSNVYTACSISATYQTYTVTFMDGTTNKGSQTVRKGATATAPTNITKDGYAIEGWYTNSTLTTKYSFSTPVTGDITLYVKWVESTMNVTYSQGNYESAAIEWDDTNASAATVEYKLATAADTAYVAVDSELIRQIDSDTARVDVLGLKGGETYNFKITSGTNGETIETLSIKKYDRSGYAHFNYTSGVGAYKDDGTLKENAIVLYVTDENKNTVTLSYGGVTVTGIGNILNSVGQDVGGGLAANGGSANTNKGILKLLAQNNVPLVVRFVGCVSNTGLYAKGTFNASSTPLIDGLTIYDSTGNGGTVGDNGHMARMKSAKDVTLEGVGEDATIDGWGFHFMCESSAADLGKSFEVRNLTFINTPEDAIGMEGVQISASASSDLSASVERCWIHNNEFYGPSISNPAESDKAEGDGSCDFKRGQYFTCSYNYFEGCHKTNLVGSADSSLQFNLTYHHNYWRLCKARGPLARNANIHMYNNVFEEQTDYCMNPRATSYIYSEYNLFFMCKNPQQVAGGALKSYNDSFSSCIGNMNGTVVTDKSQTISNSCQFSARGIDYSKFDTTASQSYIPTGDYELQTNVTEARKVIAASCGVTKRYAKDAANVDLSEVSVVPSGVTPASISVPTSVAPGKINKTVYAFTITSAATVTVSYSSDTYASTGVLLNQAGECLLTASGSVVLEPGTYIVQPTNFQPGDSKALTHGVFKTITINSITFEEYNSEELNTKLIADYNTKAGLIDIDAIAYNDASYQLIANAQNAYARLSSDLQAKVSVPYSTVTAALAKYIDLGETEVETLISAIGTVTVDSGSAISKARTAYQTLISIAPSASVSNYATLVAAEEAYENFKVEGLNNQIAALADPSSVSTEEEIESLLEEYLSVQDTYDTLDATQKSQITNYSKVTAGITALNEKLVQVQAYAEITEKLAAVTDVSLLSNAECADIVTLYGKLSEEKQTEIAANATYIAVKDKYDTYMSQAITWNHTTGLENCDNSFFTVVGNDKAVDITTNGVHYTNSIKMESGSTTSITFTTTTKMQFTIYSAGTGAAIKVDGTSYSFSNGVVTVTLEAGSHSVTKDSTNVFVYLMELAPIV
ncbi:MAG: Ig-like domain-containing protein [Candidatus Coproplasma sp.]